MLFISILGGIVLICPLDSNFILRASEHFYKGSTYCYSTDRKARDTEVM